MTKLMKRQYNICRYYRIAGVEEIKALLQGSVIIKFANAQAAQEQIEHDYLRAVAIITRTIRKEK